MVLVSKVILLMVSPQTYQADLMDILESVLENLDKTLMLCFNSTPEYILSQMDLMLRDKVIPHRTLFFLDAASHQKSQLENVKYLGEETSLEWVELGITEAISQFQPRYFILDSLDSLLGYDDVKKFMQNLINTVNNKSINSIFLAGADNEEQELIKDVQRRVNMTFKYEELRREAADWTEYRLA